MSLTFNTKTYTLDKSGLDSAGYIGAAKTLSIKDDLTLGRTAPKPTAVFSGVARSSAKLTRTHTLTGALTPTGEAIVQLSGSWPVGMASADIDAMLNDFGALVSGADFKNHVKKQQVQF